VDEGLDFDGGAHAPPPAEDDGEAGTEGDEAPPPEEDEGTSGSEETDDVDPGATDEGSSGDGVDPPDDTGTAEPGNTGDGGATETGTGEAAPDGAQPDEGLYSHCLASDECTIGNCILRGDHTNGFCTQECYEGDPDLCAPSPGGTAERTCIQVVGLQICALDCSSGKTCPTGMDCVAENDELGPREICI
jgi:hypothetical protein